MARDPLRGTGADILDAARRLFAAWGYDTTSMATVAAEVGLVESAIYRHFPSKRALLHAVIASFYEPLIATTSAALEGITGQRDRLRFLIWTQLRAFTERPDVCRLVIEEARRSEGHEHSPVGDLNRRYTALAVAVVAEGQRSGEFRADVPPAMVRDLIYGGIEHLAWKVVTGTATLDVDATADRLVDLVASGIATGTPDPGLAARVARLEQAFEGHP